MKKLQLTAALTLVLLLASTAGAQIVGSDHDFSNQTWTGGRICIVCHTAHNADITSVPGAPLWNYFNSTATSQIYTSKCPLPLRVARPSTSRAPGPCSRAGGALAGNLDSSSPTPSNASRPV